VLDILLILLLVLFFVLLVFLLLLFLFFLLLLEAPQQAMRFACALRRSWLTPPLFRELSCFQDILRNQEVGHGAICRGGC
jgi:hypothetical protein